MILRRLPLSAFAAALWLSSASTGAQESQVTTGVEILPFDAVWEWLMILQFTPEVQMDPATLDPDFLDTWTTPAYDGPSFSSGPGPLRYGEMDILLPGSGFAHPQGTVMFNPPTQSRGTVYCRTTFNIPAELTNVRLEFVVDDGFILYVDGVRRFSFNMGANATSAFAERAVTQSDESTLSTLTTTLDGTPLPPLSPGQHTLHLSLHNQSFVSGDLGLLLRITGDLTRAFPSLTASVSPPSTDGTPRLLLEAKHLDPSTTFFVEVSDDLTHWSPTYSFPGDGERTKFTLDVPAVAGRRYFRLSK
jgi:hypothetical protein